MSDSQDEPPEQTTAPADLRRTFWTVVGLVNIAVLGLTVGGLLVFFPGWTTAGVGAFAIGAGAAGLAYYRYWQFKTSRV